MFTWEQVTLKSLWAFPYFLKNKWMQICKGGNMRDISFRFVCRMPVMSQRCLGARKCKSSTSFRRTDVCFSKSKNGINFSDFDHWGRLAWCWHCGRQSFRVVGPLGAIGEEDMQLFWQLHGPALRFLVNKDMSSWSALRADWRRASVLCPWILLASLCHRGALAPTGRRATMFLNTQGFLFLLSWTTLSMSRRGTLRLSSVFLRGRFWKARFL